MCSNYYYTLSHNLQFLSRGESLLYLYFNVSKCINCTNQNKMRHANKIETRGLKN